MTEHERTIGKLEAQVERLQRDVAAMDLKLDQIVALVDQGRGAKAAITVVASLFGGAGSLLAAWAGGFLGRH